MKYNSAIKKNELLIHTVTRTNLKSIIVSKRTQTLKKATYVLSIPFIWHSGKDKSVRTEIRLFVAKGWEGRRRMTKKRHKGTCWSDENIFYLDCGGGSYVRVYHH